MSKRAFQQVLFCTVAWSAVGAQAVGIGRTVPSAVLGQPLNISIPLRTEPGERLGRDCVAAEVIAGDSIISPAQVRVQLLPGGSEQDWVARVSTSGPMLEPVVEIALTAGCDRRFVRRFTALVDPPHLANTAPVGMAISAPVVGADPVMGTPLAARGAASTPTLAARNKSEGGSKVVTMADELAAQESGKASKKKPKRSHRDAEAPSPAVSSASGEGARASKAKETRKAPTVIKLADVGAKEAPKAPSRQLDDTQVARLLLDVGSGPRLRLDMEEPLMKAPGGALPASAVEDGADINRLKLLEKTLADMRREKQSTQDATAGLKTRLAEAESQSRLLPWLGGLLVLVGGVALWLALRMRKQEKEREANNPQWWASGLPGDSRGPVPVPPGSDLSGLEPRREPVIISEPADAVASSASVGGVWTDSGLPPEVTAEKTAVQPHVYGLSSASGSLLDGGGTPREVSVEELLDLEQQADFFIALGQDEAAVDLLMTHLRSTGGLSPLPYTKLLEIYKRQEDPTAYERIRARFNRRFNVYAPDWEAGPLAGRNLEDYGHAVEQLQAVWASPLDAMATLEAMLFRKDDGQDMFDLPAYKDVLLLYSLARDLWQQGGSSATEVDVLLPLGDAASLTGPGTLDEPAPAEPGGFQLTTFDFQSSVHPDAKPGAINSPTALPDISGLSLDKRH